jgi:3-methyladenine DNA glycosylase AlkC
MTAPKNKGGRPSNAELAARGMTKTDLDVGLKTLKRYFGRAAEKIVELASNPELPVDKQFKMNQDLINMFMAMLKADAMLKQAAARDDGNNEMNTDTDDKPKGVVFDF